MWPASAGKVRIPKFRGSGGNSCRSEGACLRRRLQRRIRQRIQTLLIRVLTFSEYAPILGQTMKSEFMDIREQRLYPTTVIHRVHVFELSGSSGSL